MAKTVVFLAAFVGLSLLDCFVHVGVVASGGMKTSRWTGREETAASSPELFQNCRSKVLSLLVLSCLVLYFVCLSVVFVTATAFSSYCLFTSFYYLKKSN